MVGILGLGSRPSPSADSRRSEAPSSGGTALPESSQTRVAASDSDEPSSGGVLHFFSLPHWTRRILPASPSARKSFAGLMHADENEEIPPKPSISGQLVEKALPQLPSVEPDVNTSCIGPSADSSDSAQHVTPSQPTFYLDVYHNTPMIPSQSQVSSVMFASLPNNNRENTIRKCKSAQSLRPTEQCSKPPNSLDEPRSRGISMTRVLTSKQAEIAPDVGSGHHPSTPLVRKSSFWRKTTKSSSRHLTVPSESPLLPAVHTSPFQVDFHSTSSAPPVRQSIGRSGSRVSRCHSEGVSHHPSDANIHGFPPVPITLNGARPATADPYALSSLRSPPRRPTTADSTTRSRARSFFTLSPPPMTFPSHNESLPVNLTPQAKNVPSNTRPRSSTNPPLLHRLSVNLFASSPLSSTKNGSLFTNVATTSPISRSPRPSLSQIPSDMLRPQLDEGPEAFVNRLVSIVSKADITGVLASSGDPIYSDSLKLFIERFQFRGDPLDVALRRLLMDVGLPRETQQIDRVIEAFANRYFACNPDLFTSRDHPYILAFSLIMLHTDAFNRSNKRKMTKTDYLKNTTLPGTIPEVLDCFYDNIVFAPFIFIEDPLDPEGSVEGTLTRPSTSSGLPSPLIQNGNPLLSKPKIDPYYLISNNLLDQLRVDVESLVPLANPYRWDGCGSAWNYDEILLAFAKANVVEIGSADSRPIIGFFSLGLGGIPSPSSTGFGATSEILSSPETRTIKFAKIAVLNRKDDLLEGGKKPLNRKWRPFSVALTKSQLLLFRDLSWSSTLLSWNSLPNRSPIPSTSFKPDEIIPLNNALAVLDHSYSKHPNVFRLITHDGRHILFQANEEKEMDEWISFINYASAFKTAGIRMRPLAMPGKDAELTGVAAAASHLHDMQLLNTGQPRVLTWDHRNHSDSVNESSGDGSLHNGVSAESDELRTGLAEFSAPEIEGAGQFKETFDTVKAELAAVRLSAGDFSLTEVVPLPKVDQGHLTSRSETIRAHVEGLENRICSVNAQIDSSMHFTRNIAVLAPFSRSTRDHLQDAVQNMSKRIFAMRLDVTRLLCHRNVLLNDLAVEEKNFKRTTTLALQAATETLQHRSSEYTSSSSLYGLDLYPDRSLQEEHPLVTSQSFDSSASNNTRSALDLGPDWPSSGEALATSSFFVSPRITDSPVTQGCDSSTDCEVPPEEPSQLSLSVSMPPNTLLHEKPSAGHDFPELAEEWDKTRAAKRVSLVKLPSDLRLSAIVGRSSLHLRGNDTLREEPSDLS